MAAHLDKLAFSILKVARGNFEYFEIKLYKLETFKNVCTEAVKFVQNKDKQGRKNMQDNHVMQSRKK